MHITIESYRHHWYMSEATRTGGESGTFWSRATHTMRVATE